MPTLKIAPPTKQRITLTIPALRGVMIGTIVKNSIPMPSESNIESHNFCFAMTAAITKIAAKIETRKIFESILITTFAADTEPRSNESPATLPPIIEPIKNAISILAPATKLIAIFEMI